METNQLMARPALEPLMFTEDQRRMIRDAYANGASDEEFEVLMEVAKARRLNPLLRQVHFVSRYDSQKSRSVWAVQVSIDGLRAIAERTGLYDGQDEPEFVDNPDGTPKLCRVRVYRKDWTRPAVGAAYWDEYVQTMRDKTTGKTVPSSMWRKMPHVMLAKVAESLAIRKAFPEDSGGLYTTEEMAQASNDAPEAESNGDARPQVSAAKRARPQVEAPKPAALPAPGAQEPHQSPAVVAPVQPSPEGEKAPAQPSAAEQAIAAARVIADEDKGATLPTLDRYNARVAAVALPGDAVALWLAYRGELAPLHADTRAKAWQDLCAQVERVGKIQNARVWLKKSISLADDAALAADAWKLSLEGMRAHADALPDAAAVLADAREHHSLVGYGPVLIDRLVALGVAREQASADVPRVMREARERAPRDDGPRGGKKPASVPPPADVQGDRTAANDSGAQPSASVTVLPGLPEWATTADGIAAHMSTLTARAHLENSVRLHGRRLGEAYKTPAVARLVAIDTPADDGRRLTEIGARILVDGWAHQGPRKTVRRDGAVR